MDHDARGKGRPERRFLLSDGMVLIAATALGLGAAQDYISNQQESGAPTITTAGSVLLPISYVALFWTLAVMPLWLRGPRPSRRRLVRQPGFMVSLAITVQVIFTFYCEIRDSLQDWRTDPWTQLHNLLWVSTFPGLIGVEIMVIWLIMLLSGAMRPEASWIDRLGRALGVFWMAWGILPVWRWIWL